MTSPFSIARPLRRAKHALLGHAARHPRAFANGATITLLGACWLMLGAFVAGQYHGTLEDSYSDLTASRQTLSASFSSNYAAAKSILGFADEWITEHPDAENPAAVNGLGRFIGNHQNAVGQPNLILLIDSAGREQSIAAKSEGDRFKADAHLDSFGALDALRADALYLGLQRYDPISRSLVLPVLRKASPNRLGIAYLETQIPIHPGDAPLATILSNWPAEVGIQRADGTIIFAWPQQTAGAVGKSGPGIGRKPSAEDAGWIALPDFAARGARLFAGSPLDGAPAATYATIEHAVILHRVWDQVCLPLLIVSVASLFLLGLSWLVGRLLTINAIETRRTAEALHAAQTANAAKSQFLANMSHELRTPLNAILGFGEVLHSELFGPLGNTRYQRYAGDIVGAGRHLLDLIQNILDMSRIEAGRIKIGSTPIVVATALRETENLLSERMHQSDVALRLEVQSDCPRLLMEPTHLKQLLLNVIGNAVKFSKPGGFVTAHAALENDALHLTISDQGIGIPADQIDSLFRPFAQAKNGQARNHDGIGLGLAISRSIVEAYGATIALESVVNEGTSVTMRFPASRLDTKPAQRAAAE